MFKIKNLIKWLLGSVVSLSFLGLVALAAPTSPGGGSPTTPGALCLDDSNTWILCESTFTFGDTSARIAEIWATDLNVSGVFTFGGTIVGPLLNSDGTAAAPSYSFSADTNTGIYRSAADTLGFSVNGARALSLNTTASTGGLVLPTGTALRLFNTADEVTTYTMLASDWSSNIARIYTYPSATGTARNLQISAFPTSAAAQTATITLKAATNAIQFHGSEIHKQRSAATPVTAANTDFIIGVTGSGARTVALPSAVTATTGAIYIVKDESGSADTGTITISSGGGQIDGNVAGNNTITTKYGSRSFYSNGTNWFNF